MDDRVQDYLFDLQGYLVLKNAISPSDLHEMNQWIDDHESYIKEPWSTDGDPKKKGRWIGHIETHTYNEENGVNFQSIIEGGPVFEKLIDHPAWINLVKKYIHSSVNGLSIHENFLNVRGPGGYLHIHCGGHVPLSYLTFRQNNTGEWMVGQINVLMALNDIGEGDGPPVLIPGSHKCTEIHPRLEVDGRGLIYDDVSGKPAGTATRHARNVSESGRRFVIHGCDNTRRGRTNQSRLSANDCLSLFPQIRARAIKLSNFRRTVTTFDPRKTGHY